MPTSKKESVYFGMIMCFGMVIVMTIYNLFLNELVGVVSFAEIFIQFIIGFIVALLLDLFVVGPAAKKAAFKLPYDKSKKGYVILAISTCMVIGMVLCMSLYGLIASYLFHGLGSASFTKDYLDLVMKNFIVAYPLQLLIMGPTVRYVFIKLVKRNSFAETA